MPKKLIAAILVIAAGALGFWFLQQQQQSPTVVTLPKFKTEKSPSAITETPLEGPVIRDDPPLASTPPTSETEPDSVIPAPAIVPAPERIEQSDTRVKEAVTQLDPALINWMLPEEQIRKWVVLINQVADGKVPVKNRPLEYPLPAFQVQKKGDTLWLNHANYQRTNALISALTQIPPEQITRYYHAWLPLLQQAQDELGSGGKFHDRLLLAIARVQAIKPLEGDVKLVKGKRFYLFADSTLENASALEKLLWRLGPDNSLRLQQYLGQLPPLL